MKINTLLSLMLLALTAACTTTTPSYTVDSPNSAAKQNPDTLLKAMSHKLGSAKQLSFHANRTVDPSLAKQLGIQQQANIHIIAARPDKAVAHSVAKNDVRHMYFDGKQFTLAHDTGKVYSTVTLKATLDALPERLQHGYGYVPPLSEFIVSDIYKRLKSQTKGISYLGTGTITYGNVKTKCHRIALSGQNGDSALWLSEEDLLPRLLTTTTKGSSKPGLVEQFYGWNLTNQPCTGCFTYKPAPGATAIDMVKTSDMVRSD